MAGDLAQLVVHELRAFLRPLTLVAQADDPVLAAQRFVRACGWSTTGPVDPAPIVDLVAGLEEAFAVFDGDLVPDSLPEALDRIDAIAELVTAARSIGESLATTAIPGPVSAAAVASFGADVVAHLLDIWLRGKGPLLDIATVLGIVERVDAPATEGGALTRPAGGRLHLRLDLLPGLLAAPTEHLAARFAPDGWDQPEGAVATNLLLRSLVGRLVRSLGGRWAADPDLLRRPDEIAERGRHAVVALPLPAAAEGSAGAFEVELELLSAADRTAAGASGPAVQVTPHGTFASHGEVGDWSFDATASLVVGGAAPAALPALTIGAGGVETVPGVAARVELAAQHPLDLVVGTGGTGLTLGDVQLAVFGTVDGGVANTGFSVVAAGSSVGISTADLGSVVSSIVQFDASLPFDLGLEWSRAGGLRLAGSASLELLLSSGFDVGIVALGDIRLAFALGEQCTILVTVDVATSIGPVDLALHGIGLAVTLHLDGVRLGVELVPPTRLVVTITSEAVNGGGFLEIDPETGRYAGGLALDILGFGIGAVVVVDTEVPGDPDGFALFASLGLTFPTPIPIGFGFTLLGVGGLLALDRTMDVDALAGALRTGAADSILFPDDLLHDADAVLAGLDQWFPAQPSTTVVGPVVKIGWGNPTLITAQLGVVIAVPDLIIALLGSVEILLPSPEAPLLTLRMDILGAVDVPAATVIVAASLHDSNLLGIFELSGDMGFYACLAAQPLFVLSIGGYHPQFDPPGALPSWLLDLRRTQAAVPLGDTVDVVLTSYVAVTSNTFQFGGRFRIEARLEVAFTTYTAEGWFGVNVLLVLKPFTIVARATAGVSISAGDKELLGVDLTARVEGPQPWYATGRASFTFFGFDVEFSFDVGTQPGGEPREQHDVAADVVAALSATAAWEAAEPTDPWARGVVMADERPEGLWVRPDQVVELRQSIAPLNRTMTAYGELVPEAPIVVADGVTIAGSAVPSPEWLDDWFAPAQFDRLDDTARLSSPSFELMTAGVRSGADGIGISTRPDAECTAVSRAPEESVFPDASGHVVVSDHVSGVRPAAGPAATRTVGGERITVLPTTYTVVRTVDGVRAAGVGPSLTYAEAVATVAARPAHRRSLCRVAPAHAAVAVASPSHPTHRSG